MVSNSVINQFSTMNNIMDQYVNQIMQQAGIANLPEDFKKDYVAKLSAEAQRRLGIMAMGEMDEQGLKDFEQLMEENKEQNPQALMEFFKARIPDFENKVTVALKQFAEEFVDGAAKLKKASN